MSNGAWSGLQRCRAWSQTAPGVAPNGGRALSNLAGSGLNWDREWSQTGWVWSQTGREWFETHPGLHPSLNLSLHPIFRHSASRDKAARRSLRGAAGATLHLAAKKGAGRAELYNFATLRRAAKSAWAGRVEFSLTLRLEPTEAGADRISLFATLHPSRRKRAGGARDGATGRVISSRFCV